MRNSPRSLSKEPPTDRPISTPDTRRSLWRWPPPPRLLKNVEIQNRLAEFQQKQEVEATLTLEEHMKELKLLREMAKADGDMKPAITAEVKRSEVRKFYIRQVETGKPGTSPI
jgi:hypothetical protein